MVKELKANCDSLKQQMSTVTREKEEIEMKLREVEIERLVCFRFITYVHISITRYVLMRDCIPCG